MAPNYHVITRLQCTTITMPHKFLCIIGKITPQSKVLSADTYVFCLYWSPNSAVFHSESQQWVCCWYKSHHLLLGQAHRFRDKLTWCSVLWRQVGSSPGQCAESVWWMVAKSFDTTSTTYSDAAADWTMWSGLFTSDIINNLFRDNPVNQYQKNICPLTHYVSSVV